MDYSKKENWENYSRYNSNEFSFMDIGIQQSFHQTQIKEDDVERGPSNDFYGYFIGEFKLISYESGPLNDC